MNTQRTAVLVLGLEEDVSNFDEVMYNQEDALLGRLPKALTLRPDKLILGLGVSSLSKHDEVAINHIMSSLVNYGRYAEKLLLEAELDICSRTTKEEIQYGLGFCQTSDYEKLIVVSNPAHKARCEQIHAELLELTESFKAIDFQFVESDVEINGWKQADNTIIEMPHKKGDPQLNLPEELYLAKQARRFYKIPPEKMGDFLYKLADLINEHTDVNTS